MLGSRTYWLLFVREYEISKSEAARPAPLRTKIILYELPADKANSILNTN
jgi:hypothetical protein